VKGRPTAGKICDARSEWKNGNQTNQNSLRVGTRNHRRAYTINKKHFFLLGKPDTCLPKHGPMN
jgi:hypothetical protein